MSPPGETHAIYAEAFAEALSGGAPHVTTIHFFLALALNQLGSGDTLTAGVVVDDCASPFYGKRFSIGQLSQQARTEMCEYLRFDARIGELDYVPQITQAGKRCCD